MMDLLWQLLGMAVLAGSVWLGFKSWRRGREIEALKRSEAARKAAEAAMVAESIRRLHVVRSAPDKPVDAGKRDAFL